MAPYLKGGTLVRGLRLMAAAILLAGAGIANAETPTMTEETPPVVEPEARPTKGFEWAIRLGMAIPFGDATDQALGMGDLFEPQLNLALDLGGMITRNLFLGAYLGAGIGRQGPSTAQFGDRRAATLGRVGVQLNYQFMPGAELNPWLGYGIGLTGAWLTDYGDGHKYTELLGGIEYAHVQGGLDYNIGRDMRLGLYVDYALGQFNVDRRIVSDVVEYSGEINDKGLHHWFMVGPRLTF